jgi:hypothetical protein
MIDSIIKDFKASLYERTASPLFVTFIASWAIWNFRMIIAILSSGELEPKLAKLDKLIAPEFWDRVLQFGLYPLLSSLAFLIIYPYPARWVYKYWQTQQKLLKETRQKIEDETPLTLIEARKIRSQFGELQSRYRKDIDERDTTISDLREKCDGLEQRIIQSSTPQTVLENLVPLEISNESSTLDPDGRKGVLSARRRMVIDVMRQLEDAHATAHEDVIIEKSKLARSEALLALDELRQADMVKSYSDGQTFYTFTPKGRAQAVEKKLAT